MGKLIGLFVPILGLSASVLADTGEYTITNRMEILGSIAPINNDYQAVKVLSQTALMTTIEVNYRPYFKPAPLVPDMNWQRHDQSMVEYLKPSVTANWDQEFRDRLLKDLAASGIDPSKLSDIDTVKQVSRWLIRNFQNPGPFIAYYVVFKGGKPVVPGSMRAEFDLEKKNLKLTTDQEAFDRGLFGKGIYQNRSAGSCTPSAILWTTVFRALGIPTRIIVNVPAVDANDRAQILAAEAAIHDPAIQRTTFLGFSRLAAHEPNWASHTFNEVYVGGRWARLNYNALDQPIVDENYMGLLTEVERVVDWSDSRLVETWGARGAASTDPQDLIPRMSSQNPYRSLSISDNASGPATPIHLTATPIQGWLSSDPLLPSWMKASLSPRPGVTEIVLSIAETVRDRDFTPLQAFSMYASPHLILRIPGKADTVATRFEARVYWHPTDPHGYVMDFPVETTGLPSGTTLEIDSPADNDPNISWLFPSPLRIRVP